MRGQRSPRRLVGGSNHECRWQPRDGCGVVSRVLQHHGPSLSRRKLDSSCPFKGAGSWSTDCLQADRADHRRALLRSHRRNQCTRPREQLLEHGERAGPSTVTVPLARLLLVTLEAARLQADAQSAPGAPLVAELLARDRRRRARHGAPGLRPPASRGTTRAAGGRRSTRPGWSTRSPARRARHSSLRHGMRSRPQPGDTLRKAG